MTTEFDLDLGDGHTLHAYDVGGAGGLAVFWHHGTPNVGAPPKPLFDAAERLGIRWLSYDRPGYGGSRRLPGRNVASAAACAAAVADALSIATFAVMGHSGGGPHALACAALLPERVLGAVSVSGLAPYGVPDLDWFGGMNDSGIASLRAALQGLEAKERFEASGAEYDPEFTPADLVPAAHSDWLARRLPRTELRLTSGDGHISVLNSAVPALEWLRSVAP